MNLGRINWPEASGQARRRALPDAVSVPQALSHLEPVKTSQARPHIIKIIFDRHSYIDW